MFDCNRKSSFFATCLKVLSSGGGKNIQRVLGCENLDYRQQLKDMELFVKRTSMQLSTRETVHVPTMTVASI
jgi:hypothetical protein